jgi:hypothetical protein
MPGFKLDLNKIFSSISGLKYCIIKIPTDFPNYDKGSDLDIFCYNLESLSQVIISELQVGIPSDFSVNVTIKNGQTYIDLMDRDCIHLRFDIYNKLPIYKNILIKEAYFSSVIEHSELHSVQGLPVKVPSEIDDVLLRYVEYQEFYSERPDKIKHIAYIEKKIVEKDVDRDEIFDRLHFYTALPKAYQIENRSNSADLKVRITSNLVGRALRYLKRNGLRKTAIKIRDILKK